MDADEDDVGSAEGGAVGVDAANAFFEGDVFGFGVEEDEHKKRELAVSRFPLQR